MKKRILLVDDDPVIRGLLRIPLHDEGYEVVEMENGLEASQWTLNNRPDLIVLDVVMPKMDGIEFAYQMKSRYPGLPILAVSVGDTVMSQDLCLRFMKSLGTVEALPKPFDLKDLVKRVKALLTAKAN